MKKCIIFLLVISCTVFPGCALFQLPGLLVQELVPMIIQYAPYALMFIEETNEKVIVHRDLDQFRHELNNIPKSPDELNELSYTVRKKLAQTDVKFQSIYVLSLKNLSEQQIIETYKKISQNNKIHYQFVKVTDSHIFQESIAKLKSETAIPLHLASTE